MDNKYPRGSEWRKWDLHIHSPDTRLENGYKGGWDPYLDALAKNDIAVFGITNYFCFADDELERARNGLEKRGVEKTIFGNLEFRISQTNKQGEFINIHVLFSERLATDEINRRISHLPLINTADASGRRVVHCSPKDMRDAGLDFDRITVDFFELEKLFRENFEHDIYLLAACPSGYGAFRPAKGDGRGAGLAVEFDKLCVLMLGVQSDRDFYLKEDRYEGALPKPVVTGSDAHQIDQIGRRVCWIKANPNFEGLRQILFEPADRVSLANENPNARFPKPFFNEVVVDGAVIPQQPIRFANDLIHLNSDLVAVIGGRGTGKSMFLDCLRRRFQAPSERENRQYAKVSPEVFQVQFTKQGGEETVVFDADAEGALTYLHVSQGDIREIALQPRRLSEEIKTLLGIRELDTTADLDTEIAAVLVERNDIRRWYAETDEEGNRINSKEFNDRIIKANDERVKTLTSPENKALVEAYNQNQQQQRTAETLQQRLVGLRSRLDGFEKEADAQIKSINESLVGHKLEIPYVDLSSQKEAIKTAIAALTLEINRLTKIGDTILSQLKAKGIEQDPKGLLDKVSAFQREIGVARERLKNFERQRKRALEIIEHRKNLVETVMNGLKQSADLVNESFRKLKIGQDGWTEDQVSLINRLLGDVEIKGQIYFDRNAFYAGLENVLNLKKFREAAGVTRLDRLETKFAVRSFEDFCSLIAGQPIIVGDNERGISVDEFARQHEYFVQYEEYDLFEYIFRPSFQRRYVRVLASIQYRGKTPDKLSVGQRGTFFVCMKLATDPFGSPFVFDQPEDDLDNEFIVDELVPLFRDIKRYRQVIIATHNANLVVNADADEIIIASNESEVLSYNSGAIEDPNIRAAICKILEGGEEAFLKRELKYGFVP